jgi:hypothetical protein
VPAQSLTHAALDTVALVRFTQHFARGKTDARSDAIPGRTTERQKPAHGRGLALARRGIGTLEVSVLSQARA